MLRVATSEFVGIYFWHTTGGVPKPDNFDVVAVQTIDNAVTPVNYFAIGEPGFRHNSTAFGKTAER